MPSLKKQNKNENCRPPTIVEIEVNRLCNLSCKYCPNAFFPQGEESFINKELFRKILVELAEINFCGYMSFHFYNEPLLHPDLASLIKLVTSTLPAAVPVLYTNGTLLDDARYNELIKSGVKLFIVTQHGRYRLPIRPKQLLQMPGHLRLTNRGGFLGKPIIADQVPCYIPTEALIVTVDGKVLQCFEDVHRKHVIGDLTVSTVKEVWNGHYIHEIRQQLQLGNRAQFPKLCGGCNNYDCQSAGEIAWFKKEISHG